jgi:hypothetical protein
VAPAKRIAVITSASSIPEEVGQNYIEPSVGWV